MAWNIKGDFFETCSCEYLCPCIFTNLEALPTETKCDFAFTFCVDKGEKDGVDLSGINFVVLMRAPGVMVEGGFIGGLIVDEKATPEQVEAISAIMSGDEGGPMAHLAPLVAEMRGVEQVPIEVTKNGVRYSVKAGDLVEQTVNGVASMSDESDVMYIEKTGHPANHRLALGKAEVSKFNAFGIEWNDTSGTRNGHFTTFSWAA